MRKKSTFHKIIICKRCGKEFLQTGPSPQYCPSCRPIIAKLTKQRWYLKNNPNAYSPKEKKICSVCGGKYASSINGIPYCNKHYLRVYVNGTPNLVGRKTTNTFSFIEDYVEVRTAKGKPFLIDRCDLEKTLACSWCRSKTGYLVATINRKVTKLHRYLLGLTDAKDTVDHIDGDPFNNRRSNLRICSTTENSKNNKLKSNNSSGYQGVRKTPNNTFSVRIMVSRKEIHIGNFKTFEEAIAARKDAELKYFGDFAPSICR